MAAPMNSEKMSKSSSEDESDETNLLSPNFNPLKALYSPSVQLPSPRATIFNNLWEYAKVTSGQSSRQTVQRRDGQANVSKAAERKQKGVRSIPQGPGFRATQDMLIDSTKYKDYVYRNVITRMSEISQGPHSVLYRCMNQRCKVRVCTRSFKSLRGICTGYVVSFDKFFNMALVDVDEVWRLPSTGKRFHHEEKLTFSKIMECSRIQEQTAKSQAECQAVDGTPITRKDVAKTTHKYPSRSEQGVPLRTRHPGKHSATHSGGSDPGTRQRSSQEDKPTDGIGERRQRSSAKDRIPKKSSATGERPKRSALEEKKREEKEKGDEKEEEKEEEDIEDLQKRLAALQQELTALSGDELEDEAGSQSSKANTLDVEDSSETRLPHLHREPASVSESTETGSAETSGQTEAHAKVLDPRAQSQDPPSGSHRQEPSGKAAGDSAVKGQGQGSGGRLRIKPEEFQRRHVGQLFIRGDNVVLVSMDAAMLPK